MKLEKNIKTLRNIFWDYNVEPDEIYLILKKEKEEDKFFSREKILLRILERMGWYEVLELLGKDYLKKNLTVSLLRKIRNPNIKIRYEILRKFLQGEALSFTGWSDENSKRLKTSLLSERWYRP
jgi:hypothetical protein